MRLAIIITVILIFPAFAFSQNTWFVDDDFPTIQGAISDPSVVNGDTIIVRPGTYEENIKISKSITLIGEDKNTTIIDGGGIGNVIEITQDVYNDPDFTGVSISNFTIQNGGATYPGSGIYTYQSHPPNKNHYINITNNIITDNQHGIEFGNTNSGRIEGNKIVLNHRDGIYLRSSSYYVVSGNDILENGDQGIYCYWDNAINNTISNNKIYSNASDGIQLYWSSGNTVENNDLRYNRRNGIWAHHLSHNNIIRNNVIILNVKIGVGVTVSSYDNVIKGNKICSNKHGIYISQDSCGHIISENGVGNGNYGIYIENSSNDNLIFHNNITENGRNGSDSCTNTWDDDDPSGGNYWSDYTGTDRGDGIGDVPYDIPYGSNQDRYPFMSRLPFPYCGEPPVADAGPDQTVNEGDFVILNGSNSYDPNEYPLDYYWEQVAGQPVQLDLTNPVLPSFVAPFVASGGATFTFRLIVNNGYEGSDPDFVDIIVKNMNHPPVADAGEDQYVNEGSGVVLDGTGSYDEDGEDLVFAWSQIQGREVALSDPNSPTPTFTAPLITTSCEVLVFKLTVTDGIDLDWDSVSVFVENVNHPPVAEAGEAQTVDELTFVQLDGTASSDPDQDPLTFWWIQVDGPTVSLSNQSSPTPTFTAPGVCCGEIAHLVFELTVNDGFVDSDPDSVVVSVRDVNAPPDCSLAHPSEDYLWPPNHKMHSISILGVTDPDDNEVTITVTAVTQDEPVNGLGDGDTAPDAILQGETVLIRAERSGTGNGRVYRIEFIADDGAGGNCSGSVTVFVPHDMKKPIQAIDDGQLYDSTEE